MATRIVDFPQTETRYDTDKVYHDKRQQYFNDVTFTCHLCQESVKRATFLSCLHSFCKTCIHEKVKLEGTELIQCPLCPSYEDESLELQINPLPELINNLKQLKTSDNLRCTDCVFGDAGETAVAYCVECKATICEIDLKCHEKYNIGHLILQLHTLQESSVQDILTSLQASTGDSNTGVGTKEEYEHPEDNVHISSSTNKLQEECILEARSHISQLEDRKSNLENKWNEQTKQVLTFFQQLYKQLETRQAVLLEELSRKYQTLITPLEDHIQQLEQIVTYTCYVGMLSRYSYVAGISDKPGDKLQDISLFVNDFDTPSDSYSVNVNQKTEQEIQISLNEFLTVHKADNPKLQSAFIPEKHKSYKLTSRQILIHSPSDITYNSTTKVYYALFYTHWETYKRIHNVLKIQQTIRVTVPAAFQMNSSIALSDDSVVIMSNHTLYVYSEDGGILKQFDIKQICTVLNPKLFTFSGNNSVYIACIDSNICKVNTQTGVNERRINLTSNTNLTNINFVDMVRSTTETNQLLILHTATRTINTRVGRKSKSFHNQSCQYTGQDQSANNQYYIQVYSINNLQLSGIYILSQTMSLFCCITTLVDIIYVLDVCGSVHSYKLNQIQSSDPYRRYVDDDGYHPHANINLNQVSVYLNSFTDNDVKNLDDTIRAFSDETNKQIMLLSSGEIHFIS